MKYLYLSLSLLFLACQSKRTEAERKIPALEIIELASPIDQSLRGISVVDSNIIWLSGAGGSILRTTDGGDEWQELPAPDLDSLDFRDVHAFSAEEAVVMSAGFPARVYRTQDAGRHWELVYENLDSAAFMDALHFRSQQNGLIVGDRLNDYHFVLESEDGGRSWERIDSVLLPQALAVEHAFAASGSNITTDLDGNWVLAFGGEASRVFRQSVDKSWQASETGLGDSSASSGIYSISQGEDRMIAVGGDYLRPNDPTHCVIYTLEKMEWLPGGQLSGYRSVIDYSPKEKICLAAGTNGIELSADGGKHWHFQDSTSINTLQFDRQSGKAWAAGPKGEIYRIKIN